MCRCRRVVAPAVFTPWRRPAEPAWAVLVSAPSASSPAETLAGLPPRSFAVVTRMNFLFLGGAAPVCGDAADADNNGAIQLTDGIFILNFLFLGGQAPVQPGLECGEDTAQPDDGLGCETFSSCE